MSRSSHLLACAFVLAIWTLSSAACAGLVDNFEGPTLNPFWTTTQNSGSIIFPSTLQAHSGAQSVEFTSTDTGSNKGISLEHTFAQPVYGQFSVWIYDTGAGVYSSNYIYFSVDLLNSHVRDAIFTTDYDLGPGQNGHTYTLNPSDQDTIATSVVRSQGWHQFLVDITPSQATFEIDNVTVYTEPGIAIDHVSLSMFGPNWRPAFTSFFDDFSFQSIAAVPEPSTIALAGIGLACSGLFALRRRKKVASKL
jgi:hypothetical protein